jgi:hypothetical protein
MTGTTRAIAICLVLLGACASGPHVGSRETERSSPSAAASSVPASKASSHVFVRGCGTDVYGDLGRHPERNALVAGPLMLVALPGYAQAPPSQFRPKHGSDQGQKVLAVAKAPVRLAIGRADRRHASLFYDSSKWSLQPVHVSDGETVVKFVPCHPSPDRFGTQFNGAFLVDGPRCVTLIASWDAGKRRVMTASFGAGPCEENA